MKSNEQETKKVPAPRLRFKQFEGSGEWEEKKLGDIAMMSSGGTPSSTVSEYYGGSIPWVSISDMTKSGKYLDRTEKSLTRLGLENSAAKIFPENTILFAMYASIGKCNIASLPVSTSQAILGIIPLNDNSTDYIYYFLSDNEKKYADMGQHGTQKNLNAGMVKALPIPLPPTLPEQTHIAACLSSLDAVIDAHTDKLAALRQHKRALMQQLFPQEGEKVPRLRFPEFEGSGEWEEKKLGEICEINPRRPIADDEISVSFIAMASVSEEGYVEKSEDRLYKDVKKGYTPFINRDILIAKITPCFENGKIALVDKLTNGIGFGSTEFHVFRKRDTANERFLFAFLNRDELRGRGEASMTGNAGQRRVPITFFESLTVPLPTLPEQTHIAACLSSLDDLISAQSEKINTLKTFKRGLMQGLFPSTTNHEAAE